MTSSTAASVGTVRRLPSTPGLLGWSRLSDPERLEAFVRVSAYVLLALAPLLAGSVVVDARDWRGAGGPVFFGAVGVQFVAAVGTLRTTLDASLGRGRVRSGWLVALGTTTAAAVAVALLWFPGTAESRPPDLVLTAVVVVAAALAAIAPLLSWRALAGVGLAGAIVWGAVVAALGGSDRDVMGAVVASATVLLVVALSMRSSVWMISVFWEQERRREIDARLAVAEERLSFSRDLHDTFGRTLATVAVKSELAAELARRGRPGAAEEMLEVRQVAEVALREMRELVAGFRAPDLGAELAGARALLGSAGIAVSVTADDGELPPATQEALAWVVREAVTNVVRHSDAARCEIVLHVETDDAPSPVSAVLEVVNDGARETSGSGAGLRGLAERLERVGGDLDARRDDEEFRLVARVPLTSAVTP